MQPDKTFTVIDNDGNRHQESCHCTGYEVCLGNPDDLSDWWNEYEDQYGEKHFGR